MKLLFIPAKSKLDLQISTLQIKKARLPKKIGLISTVQFVNNLQKIKTQLEKQGKKVFVGKNRTQNLAKGQILGCNIEAATTIKDDVDAFLYIGTGKFHPLPIALATNKLVFCFNPETNQISKLDDKEILKAKALRKGQKLRYLTADKLGILVTIKPGQNKLKQAFSLRNKLKKQGKQCYIFMFDNFDENQLENWPEIECWINTTCPGLSLENPRLAWINNLEF